MIDHSLFLFARRIYEEAKAKANEIPDAACQILGFPSLT